MEQLLVPEPAEYPGEAAKLALLILDPGDQRTVGDRGGCFTSIEGVCLGNDFLIRQIALAGGVKVRLPQLPGTLIARHQSLPCLGGC
jgi:hypothetical protein